MAGTARHGDERSGEVLLELGEGDTPVGVGLPDEVGEFGRTEGALVGQAVVRSSRRRISPLRSVSISPNSALASASVSFST
ncbi:hypothetical protein [Streptomyces anulatus]|uniref:hypothetical protein n=1 Tax=Streptomyces anulatus TaxID=1892 RepID=UPI003657BCBF